jgi:hypothetical protein
MSNEGMTSKNTQKYEFPKDSSGENILQGGKYPE